MSIANVAKTLGSIATAIVAVLALARTTDQFIGHSHNEYALTGHEHDKYSLRHGGHSHSHEAKICSDIPADPRVIGGNPSRLCGEVQTGGPK